MNNQVLCDPLDNKFWLIWSPNGKYPPAKVHAFLHEAKDEALRLAKLNPNQVFYVLRVVGKASIQTAIYTEIGKGGVNG